MIIHNSLWFLHFFFLTHLSFSQNINHDIFHPSFGNYLDGPTQGVDGNLYFANGDRIMRINQGVVETFFDFKTGSHPLMKTTRISGIEIGSLGHLFLADYKNHVVWKITYNNQAYKKESPSLVFQNDLAKQPNDIATLPDGRLLLADHPLKKENGEIRPGGLWIFSPQTNKLDFIKTGGVLAGIAFDKSQGLITVASGKPCFLSTYELTPTGLTHKWKSQCSPAWSVDGLDFNNKGQLYVTRIEQGRVDVIHSSSGKILSTICLIKKNASQKCQPPTQYEVGLLPTDLTFITPDKLAISFMGKKGHSHPSQQGFIRFISTKKN